VTTVAPAILPLADSPAATQATRIASSSLLERLADALDRGGVHYCQWKGHWSSHRWATGRGDVDLLVGRESLQLFRTLIGELGFKPVQSPAHQMIPGVESYLGSDPVVPRLLHLHVHYRLVLGDYWKPVYRLPLERELLSASAPGQPFRVPAPTHQFLLFVLRLMLRQVGRPHLSVQTRWTSGVQIQLESLEACSNREELVSMLRKHLPAVDIGLFDRCVRSLKGECRAIDRALLPWLLHRRLRGHARRPSLSALFVAATEKFLPGPARLLASTRPRPISGGTVLALVGGDGAGKSTCARELIHWLGPSFPTMHAHLGNPPRSLTTIAVGGALKLQRRLERSLNRSSCPGSLLELVRYFCMARDRYRLYIRVQQFAAAGGIAVCERYPIEQNRPLVGPRIPEILPAGAGGQVIEWLRAAEAAYYTNMLGPDGIFVLRLDPEIAVARKPEEPADYVRARGRVVWETDWSRTGAHLVDASRPLPDVMQRIKEIVWSIL
jgi:thymidylate kinase